MHSYSPEASFFFNRYFLSDHWPGCEVTKLWLNTYLSSPERDHVQIDQYLAEIHVYFTGSIPQSTKLVTQTSKQGLTLVCIALICFIHSFKRFIERILGEKCCPRAGTTTVHTTKWCLPHRACSLGRDCNAQAGSAASLHPWRLFRNFTGYPILILCRL